MWAGIAYSKTGDYSNSLKEFNKANACSPSPKMYALRAATYTKMGDKEKARADLKSARTAVDNYNVGNMYSALISH